MPAEDLNIEDLLGVRDVVALPAAGCGRCQLKDCFFTAAFLVKHDAGLTAVCEWHALKLLAMCPARTMPAIILRLVRAITPAATEDD